MVLHAGWCSDWLALVESAYQMVYFLAYVMIILNLLNIKHLKEEQIKDGGMDKTGEAA